MNEREEHKGSAAGESDVLEALREVIDPELGMNIVDLGLVYGVDVQGDHISVEMTMTTRACPMSMHLKSQAESAIFQNIPGLKTVEVRLVWDPPWGPEMISKEARRQLGWER